MGHVQITYVGVYTGDDDSSTRQQFFIAESHPFVDLCEGLGSLCLCGKGPWVLESMTQVSVGCPYPLIEISHP